jgi:23S rRNA (pseudouridine1915-N3)-methyltransferase
MSVSVYPIRFVSVGRPKLEACRDLEEHYKGMLKAFCRLEHLEIPEGRSDPSRQLKEEALRIRPLLEARTAILLDAGGPSRTSEAFARWLGKRMDRGESLVFAIGSSHGFDPALKTEVSERLSLGPMTFPHDLCRVMFLEQLYRAFTILRGKTYHK